MIWQCARRSLLKVIAGGHERLTNGKPALVHWIGRGEAQFGKMKSARSIARCRSNGTSVRYQQLATAVCLNVRRNALPPDQEGSKEVIEVARAVNHPMDFNGIRPDAVEYKVGFQHQDPIPSTSQCGVARNPSQIRVPAQSPDPEIELVNKSRCPIRTVLCNKVQYAQQVILGCRQIANGELTGP
jgi:hypothetical protein